MIEMIKQIISLLHPIEKTYTSKYSKEMRDESNKKIGDMKADLNGCSDEWFLKAKDTLDECIPNDKDFL